MRMVRSLVGGDEDGDQKRPDKRPISKRHGSRSSVAKKPSKSRHRATTSTATDPESMLALMSEPEEQIPEVKKWDSGRTDSTEVNHSLVRSDEYEDGQKQQTQGSVGKERSSESGSDAAEGRSRFVSVTLRNPDVLDCPICFQPLCSTVYQCEDGHIACPSCCTTIKNTCPTCCSPIGYNRCRALENVLESVRVTCRNMPYGCKETFSYSKKLAHEKTCTFTCSCPLSGCGFVGISESVYAHFALKHPYSSMKFDFNDTISISLDETRNYVFLQEMKMGTLFVLNHSVETIGSFVNVVCVAPTSENRVFSYDITATVGESLVKMRSSVSNMPKWMAQPPEDIYLLVPSHFISSSGHLKVELIIWRHAVDLK